jgi:hypothetical protein
MALLTFLLVEQTKAKSNLKALYGTGTNSQTGLLDLPWDDDNLRREILGEL